MEGFPSPAIAMRKIGLAVSWNDAEKPLEVPLAEHFGRARWLLILESDERVELIRNEGPSGAWGADTLAEAGCTDVIAQHLGPSAFAELQRRDVQLWRGRSGVTARALAEQCRAGTLAPLESPELPGLGQADEGCCEQ